MKRTSIVLALLAVPAAATVFVVSRWMWVVENGLAG
ncbi:hypothetical protein RKD33_005983 [Streptomyces sp. SAI-129]